MFEKAWTWLKEVKYKDVDLSMSDIQRLFHEEFKCILIPDLVIPGFSAGEFENEEDASMFILKWS